MATVVISDHFIEARAYVVDPGDLDQET